MAKNQPIKTFKAGAVKASIFENENNYNGKKSTNYKVVVDKIYKDKSGSWKSTNSFSVFTELPKVQLVLSKTYEYLALKNEGETINEGSFIEESIEV